MKIKTKILSFCFVGFSSIVFGFSCQSEGVRFLAFGDAGFGSPAQFETARGMGSFCAQHGCDFVLLLGDNFYPDGVHSVSDPQWQSKFEEPYADLKFPFYPTLGNHDYFGNIEAQINYSSESSKWRFPSRFYQFQWCDVDFFVIDAERFDETQKKWLEEGLVSSRAEWKVVAGHRPIYSHGGHGDSKHLKKELLPLLKGKVDFYFAGHDHHLEYISKGYLPEFIVSGAAAENRGIKSGKSTLFGSDSLGFAHVVMKPGEATIQFVNEKGKSLFKKIRSKKSFHFKHSKGQIFD